MRSWPQEENAKLKFGVPMVWREPKKTRCLLVHLPRTCQGIQQKKQAPFAITTHTVYFAMRPIPYSDEVPVPIFHRWAQVR